MAQSLELQYIDESYQKLVQISGSYIADGTGSTINNLTVTASYATNALTASYAVTAPSASYAISASHSEDSDSAISASHAVQADNATTADSATVATTANTASYILGSNVSGPVANAVDAVSASYALTASHLLGFVTSASYAESSSYASTALSASHAVNADVVGLFNKDILDGTAYQVLRTDGAGNLSFDYADRTNIEVRTIEAVTKGDPLRVVGFNNGQNRVEVRKADASNSALMPAYGVAYETIGANQNTQMVALGALDNVNTQVAPNDFQEGDVLYVKPGGGLTNVKPTGTNLIQNVGKVARRNQNNGEILVSAIGRSNDVPNIAEGNLWVGNGDGVATASTSQSLWEGKAINVASVSASSYILAEGFIGDGSQVLNVVSSSYAVSSSLSQLAVNLTSGDKDHSGTIDQQFSAPNNYNQKNLATISGVTYGGNNYAISELTYMNYADFGPQFTNALGFSQWDSYSYNYGAELLLAPQRIQFNFTPSGSNPFGYDTTGLMGMQANGFDSQGILYASELQLGLFKGVTIGIGNRSGVSHRQTENLNINAVTSSLTTDYNYESANVGHYATGGSRGNVTAITNGGGSGTTLSLNGGNFYTLDLSTASTQLNLNTGDITNGYGQTFSIEVSNVGASNTLTFDSNFHFVGGTAPTITSGGVDILTGITFGANDIYITAVQNLS